MTKGWIERERESAEKAVRELPSWLSSQHPTAMKSVSEDTVAQPKPDRVDRRDPDTEADR